jgi:thymidylate synthase (FAD)
MYSECIWKADLQAVFNFLTLRLDTHAQAEIQAYAQVVDQLVQQAFPFAYKVFKQSCDKSTSS